MKKSIEEAEKEARCKGFLGRLFARKKPDEIVMKTIYIENRLITFEMVKEASVIDRLLKRAPSSKTSRIRMIANGSTCGVSYYDDRGIQTGELEVPEEALQRSDYSDDALSLRGNALARRILRRRVGGNMRLEVSSIESIYRPYHIAFFGAPEEGKKVFYLPIAADDCTVKRTF
ncbi:MAG: hypothetical protein RR501_11945 [Cloacibacillus sp.]